MKSSSSFFPFLKKSLELAHERPGHLGRLRLAPRRLQLGPDPPDLLSLFVDGDERRDAAQGQRRRPERVRRCRAPPGLPPPDVDLEQRGLGILAGLPDGRSAAAHVGAPQRLGRRVEAQKEHEAGGRRGLEEDLERGGIRRGRGGFGPKRCHVFERLFAVFLRFLLRESLDFDVWNAESH